MLTGQIFLLDYNLFGRTAFPRLVNKKLNLARSCLLILEVKQIEGIYIVEDYMASVAIGNIKFLLI